jgi:hypothetical protein
MRRSRLNYWSCSRFANWVRGEDKPLALEWHKWEEWSRDVSARRPIRFFIAEEVLDKAQDIIMFPGDFWHSLSSWWENRFVSKTHYLKTGLEPGRYHELDERIMHGLFNELVEFVEVELAHMQSYGEGKKYNFVRGRCAEAGVDHLLWTSDLKCGDDYFVDKDDPKYGEPTPQAESAKSILKLYRWWKEVRPNRPDPHDSSGWSLLYDEGPSAQRDEAFDRLTEIEEGYDREDDEMISLLVNIRRSLWT